MPFRQGPLDPPAPPPTTLSQLQKRKQLLPPTLPPIGFERQFRRRPTLRNGEVRDESLEVGVLRWKMGRETMSVSIQVDEEVFAGRDDKCKIQLYGPTISEFHLKFYAVRTSTDLAIVCVNDLSSQSGYILNGKHFPSNLKNKIGGQVIGSRMIVLRDGDEVQVPNTPQIMKYKHNSAHFPINPAINTHIEDYTLFSTTSPHHYIKTNHWKIHNYPLGDGTFGVVNLATHLTGGIQAAIKTIDSRRSGPETWRERVDKEVGSMKKLNHPNVMKVLDKIKNTGQRFDRDMEKMVEDENDRVWDWEKEGIWKAHIVFELATGGDLFSYMEARGALPESEARFIAYQLVLGIDHLHTHDVAHRDIKLENILLHNRNEYPRVLIGDFGFSTTLEAMIEAVPPPKGVSSVIRHYDVAGTITSLSPERLRAFSRPTKTAGLGESDHGINRRNKIGKKWFEEEMQLDHWALGVVIYYLITFRHPYTGLSDEERSRTPVNRSKTIKPKHGRDQESITQFPIQESSQDAKANGKRKFSEIDDEEEEDGDCQSLHYSCHSSGKSWAEYRKMHGERTIGGKEDDEMRLVARSIEDIKVFADEGIDAWIPNSIWEGVSSAGRGFIDAFLQKRVHDRMTASAAKDHHWFSETESKDELDRLYDLHLIRGIHRPNASRCE